MSNALNDSSAALDLPATTPGSTMQIGRYALHRQIARGGMATIHIARLMGDEGFSRIVAAKRLLPEFAEDSEFVEMFLDEARIASRVNHRNVVPVLDVVTTGDEVVLVQEFVHGVPLHWLLNRARQTKAVIPVEISVAIACQVLAGLHAAHETTDELGHALNVVHRDVSPQNVMIASDGTARLLDFGVAKSLMAAHTTREGTYKGKLAYSAPEQLRGAAVRQSDIYSLSVLLWELLVGHRMHRTAQGEAELVATIMNGQLPSFTEALAQQREWEAITEEHWKKVHALEPIITRGLAVEIEDRYQTASEMEEALLALVRPASGTAMAQWLKSLGREYMERNEKVLAAEETSWRRVAGSHAQMSIRRAHSSTVPLRPVPGRITIVPKLDDSSVATAGTEPGTAAAAAAGTAPGTTGTAAIGTAPGTAGVAGAAEVVALPAAPKASAHRWPYLLVGLLSLLVLALATGIIVVVGGRGEPRAAPASVAAPQPEPAAGPPASGTADPAAAAGAAGAAGATGAAPAGAAKPAAAKEAGTGLSIGEVETSATAAAAASAAETAPAAGAAEPTTTAAAAAAGKPRQHAGRPTGRFAPHAGASASRPAPGATAKPGAAPATAGGAAAAPAAAAAAETKPAETKPAEPQPAAKDNCNPPYYFEGNKKIFKTACL
jgi:eukaryotic-like serine/threonine-protein kinase